MNQSPNRHPWKGHAHYEVSVECGVKNRRLKTTV